MRYSVNYRVLSGQVDETKHLSNVQYYEFYKSAAFSFLKKYEFAELNKPLDLWPIIFGETAEFYKEVFFDDIIRVDIFHNDFSDKKNKYSCNGVIYNSDGDKIAAFKTAAALMNRETRKIEPMTDAALALLKQYSEDSLIELPPRKL
jgi:acyl-CoA thioesterase FadM